MKTCRNLFIIIQSRLAITRLAITRIGYNTVGRGPRISAARGEMGATANNNAVINCHLFFMKSSCLSCTGVSRNNVLILRNLTQKYNCVAEFVVCCAHGFCSAVGFAFATPIQSFFKPIYCVTSAWFVW